MKSLTFKEENGKFGVVGMNEDNQDEKLYMCVKKLKDYEELGLNPEELGFKLNELEEKKSEIEKLKNDLEFSNNFENKQLLIDGIREANEIIEYKSKLLNNSIILPEGFYLNQCVYMIPTEFNRLKKITPYSILEFSLSGIGERACLSICKKEKGIEPFYSASFDMFNQSIFKTKDEAENKLKEKL